MTSAASTLLPDAAAPDPAWDSARRQVGTGLLSIVMPAFNLGHAIVDNVRHVRTLFRGQFPFEIIVVDDGSTDHTARELARAAGEMPELRPVYLKENIGKGAALRRGFEESRGNYVLLLDGDLDLPPAQVSGFFSLMERAGVDAVIGSKHHPQSTVDAYPWHRKFVSLLYYVFVKALVGLPVRDTQTGIKLFRREALAWAFPRMLVKRFAFDLELLAIIHEHGFRIGESPITLHSQGSWSVVLPSVARQVLHDTLAVFYRLRILRYYQTIQETRMPDPLPRVSVVIALPAPSPCLDECLEGLQGQSVKPFEILLLPDAPTGRSWPEPIREIPTGRLRPAEKRNLGVARARGEMVAFLDDDAFPAPDWLRQALVYFSQDDIAAVGGPGVTPPQDPYLAKLSGDVFANRLVSGSYRYRYVPTRVREVQDLPSCNLFVRTDVLHRLGGFRVDFWPGEDTYLCLQIVRDLKQRIVYDPRVLAYHHRRPLFLPHLRQVGRYALHRGYFARHFPETSRKLSYAVPSLFVAAVASGAIASTAWPALRPVYLAALALYGFATAASCMRVHALSWLLTWIGIMLTHGIYGARFAQGLVVARLPGDVAPFDHASERAPQA